MLVNPIHRLFANMPRRTIPKSEHVSRIDAFLSWPSASIWWLNLIVDFLPQSVAKPFLWSVLSHFASVPANQNKPGLSDLDHSLYKLVPPILWIARSQPSYANQGAKNGSTKSRLERNKPSLPDFLLFVSSAFFVFFPLVIGVGAGNPMLRPCPFHSKVLECRSDCFTANTLLDQFILVTDLCCQSQCPQTGGFPKIPGTLMQNFFQLLHAFCWKGCLCVVRTTRAFLQDRYSILIKAFDNISYRLIVTAKRFRYVDCFLSSFTRQDNLTTPYDKWILWSYACLHCLFFFLRQLPNI